MKGMAAIFSYGLMIAEKNFKEENCQLVVLSDFEALIKEAIESDFITEADQKSLLEWRKNPEAWSEFVKV